MFLRLYIFGFLLFLHTSLANETTAEHWMAIGQNILRQQLQIDFNTKINEKNNNGTAKNVVLAVGSGMSITTLRAAGSIHEQNNGEKMSFESLPIVGFANSKCLDIQVADDSCAATTISTGRRGKKGTVGLTNNEKFDDDTTKNDVQTIAQWALSSGKDIGLVTTSRITHASVAAMYGHAPSDTWEADVDVFDSRRDSCLDFACQLMRNTPGKKFKVILGGGKSNFITKVHSDNRQEGRRMDGKDLIEEWIQHKKRENITYQYVEDKEQLLQINNDTEYTLGLFSSDHMQYHLLANDTKEPTLQEMVEVALRILSNSKNGYFLFILGGRIDHAHHMNQARLAIDETIQLSLAVETVRHSTDPTDTLLVVTADHGDTMTIAGYSNSDESLLNVVTYKNINFTPISYANGPGVSRYESKVEDFSNDPTYKYKTVVALDQETHGGESVVVFARGPCQELFTGSYDLDFVPYVVGYAACIGPGMHSCNSSLLDMLSSYNISPPANSAKASAYRFDYNHKNILYQVVFFFSLRFVCLTFGANLK